jgi:hypothetical protein
MKENRTGESDQPPPRSSRLFIMRNLWYFSTREGADIGPFNSRDEAVSELTNFIEFVQLAGESTLKNFLKTLSAKT